MKSPVTSLLSFISAQEIALWCGISVRTARRWKSGTVRPGRQALRLINLHREERVLKDRWHGFTVRGQHLVDPHGNTLTCGQLLAYSWIIQYAAELARQAGPEEQRRFYGLLGDT